MKIFLLLMALALCLSSVEAQHIAICTYLKSEDDEFKSLYRGSLPQGNDLPNPYQVSILSISGEKFQINPPIPTTGYSSALFTTNGKSVVIIDEDTSTGFAKIEIVDVKSNSVIRSFVLKDFFRWSHFKNFGPTYASDAIYMPTTDSFLLLGSEKEIKGSNESELGTDYPPVTIVTFNERGEINRKKFSNLKLQHPRFLSSQVFENLALITGNSSDIHPGAPSAGDFLLNVSKLFTDAYSPIQLPSLPPGIGVSPLGPYSINSNLKITMFSFDGNVAFEKNLSISSLTNDVSINSNKDDRFSSQLVFKSKFNLLPRLSEGTFNTNTIPFLFSAIDGAKLSKQSIPAIANFSNGVITLGHPIKGYVGKVVSVNSLEPKIYILNLSTRKIDIISLPDMKINNSIPLGVGLPYDITVSEQ